MGASVGSVLSILMVLASFYANKIGRKNSSSEYYYLLYSNNAKDAELTAEQTTKIDKSKGRKEALEKAMARVFGISANQLEIGHVWKERDGLRMYVGQQLTKNKLEQYNASLNTTRTGFQRTIRPRQYVRELYEKNSVKMTRVFS